MAQYGSPAYWEERYRKDTDYFDWYQRWIGLKPVLKDQISTSDDILIVGCGQSRLTEDLFEEGFKQLTNIDISSTAIDFMKAKSTGKTTINWLQMSVLDMNGFQDGTFDVVIDKGTLDSILCGEGSTNAALTMLREVSRVLKSRGRYICVTYGQPSFRNTYLRRPELDWSVDVRTVAKPTANTEVSLAADEKDAVYYIYICTKVGGAALSLTAAKAI